MPSLCGSLVIIGQVNPTWRCARKSTSTPAGAVTFSDLLLGAVVVACHKCRAKRYLSFIANIEDMDIELRSWR